MLSRFRSSILVLAAGGVLVAGCRAPAPRSVGPAKSTPPSAIADKPAPVSESALAEAHAHYGAGIISEMNEQSEDALKEYYEAAMRDPTDEGLVLEVSRLFLQAKQPDKALEVLLRATSQSKGSGALYARLGFVYSQLGKQDLAIKAARTAIQREPRTLSGYQDLFVNYLQNKQIPEALNSLDEAAKVTGVGPEFLIGLAELYVHLGLQISNQKEVTSAKALAVLQRAENSKITEPALRLRLADGFNLLGKDELAAPIYHDLIQHYPDAPYIRENVRAKLADIYLREKDHAKAIEQLEAILRDNPTDAQTYYLLGSLAYDSKDDAKAIDCFTKTLLFDPDFERAYYDLAGAQLGENKESAALATLDKARQKFPSNFVMEYLTGLAYGRMKDYTNSLSHLTAAEIVATARETNRLTEMFYFEFGATYERAGDYEQAEKYFEKCLELSPNFAEAQNYLGYMWADRGEKLERARVLIEKALVAEPKNAAYLDSMGWVLFKLKRPQEALDYLLKAVQLSGKEEEDAEVYDHLGDIYAALGQNDKARDAWQKSISLEGSETVKKKLESGK